MPFGDAVDARRGFFLFFEGLAMGWCLRKRMGVLALRAGWKMVAVGEDEERVGVDDGGRG